MKTLVILLCAIAVTASAQQLKIIPQIAPPGFTTAIAGAGSGTVTSAVIAGTADQITVSGTCTITTTGTCTLSLPSVLILPGTVSATSISTGASPPTCTAGTAGVICLKEGTAPTGEADAGMIYTKTDHLWYTKLNNGAETAMLIAGGALGTPASGVATNITGLPIGGLTGLGTGVGTALAANVSGTGGICLASGSACATGGGVSITTTGLGYFCPVAGCTSDFSSSSIATTSKVPRYYQFVQTNTVKYTTLAAYIAIAGGSGCGGMACGMAAAIYDSSCNKIAGSDLTTTTTLTAGLQSWAFATPVTLNPGIYYFGYASDSGALQFQAANDNTVWHGLVNIETDKRYFTGSNSATGDNGTLAMPSACGTRTALTSSAFVEGFAVFP